MSRSESSRYDEIGNDESQQLRRDTYRVRRASSASRRRTRKKPAAPGGIRQRRNKHWNW